ncbi:14788_t:CDS:10 [Entrophospora sp. SA101]|nr:14788_t:CDS:10 [Entrophospora sp. SA101]
MNLHRSNSSTGNLYKPLRSQHPTKLNTNEKNIAVTGTLNHFVQSKKLPVKNEELKNLLWLLQPGVPLPSADTIKNEIIKSFDKEHCWTSANTIPFLGITSHWINIDWQLQETLIDFLLAVTTDNAMNNNTFVSSLADICYNEGINFDIDNNHVRCLAHVMNIAVQHALKSLKATAANNKDEVLNIDDNDVNGFHTIMKLRKLIVKIKSSPQQQERFSKACKLANLKYKELILDIVTCWNSTYEMIMCAIEYKEITVESVGRADRYMIKWVLNEEEWSKLVEISQLLHLFSRATKHISTNHYPTLTSTVLIFNWLIDNLEDYEHNLNGTSDIKGKVKEVIEKLKFYYIRTDASVYTIATNYYRDNNWEANFINNAHQVIKDIYQSGYAPNLTVFSNPENNDIEEEEDLTAHIYKHQQIVRDDDELDAYLKSPNAPPKTDVLTWWKSKFIDGNVVKVKVKALFHSHGVTGVSTVFSLTTFSPSGKLVQIEYALNAVAQGVTSIGIKATNGVVVATEKKTASPLIDDSSLEKVANVCPNIGIVYSGMGPDFRVLLTKARKAAQKYKRIYNEYPPTGILVKEVASVMQEFTQSGGVRPFGVSLLIVGYDETGPALYQVDPSGSYWAWKASAIGKNMVNAKTFLEKRY